MRVLRSTPRPSRNWLKAAIGSNGRHVTRFVVLIVALLGAATCGKNPAEPSAGETFTAVINGEPFRPADLAATVGQFDNRHVVSVQGVNCGSGTSLQIYLERTNGQNTPGTYAAGIIGSLNVLGTLNENANTVSGAQTWDSRQGTGTVTITEMSDRVVGTFSFEMNPLLGNPGGPRSVTAGEFNVRVASRKLC
jgi:hypothetical protein